MAIERVFVAGAGLMGHGIAQVLAEIGIDVALYEPDVARAEAGLARIAGNLERAVAKGRMADGERQAALARVRPTGDPAAVTDVDLIIEAVFEDVDVKSASRSGPIGWFSPTRAPVSMSDAVPRPSS